MTGPTLSIVTGVRNRVPQLQRLLDSIRRHTAVSYEVIIGDASDIPLIEQVQLSGNISILREDPPLGHGRGYNRCFRACVGEYTLWLNDDAEVLAGYDVAALNVMKKNPQFGLACLRYADDLTRQGFHTNEMYDLPYANFGLLPTALGNQIGWFGDLLPFYGCDNVIAFEVLLAGFGITIIQHESVVHHSEMDAQRMENDRERERDGYTLKAKYGPRLAEMREVYERTRAMVMA